MPYPNIKKMDNSKSKPLHSTNIWTIDIDNEVNDPHPIIPVTNTINIEHYDLWYILSFNHVMNLKITIFRRLKFHKIIIFRDGGRT
jgi:hypothetical protein